MRSYFLVITGFSMLSYQHMYHAGGLADVHKHAALSLMLARISEKPKSISYLETHAGRGLYDLGSAEAVKTGEAAQGIVSLIETGGLAPTHPYATAMEAVRAHHGAKFYPGSPLIALTLLRGDDKMHLCELHPKEVSALQETMARSAQIYQADGYLQVLRLSPPTPRRGFVLIDPSYEIKDEYEQVAEFILALHRKWSVAVVLLWYPILESGLHAPMLKQLRAAGLPNVWEQEVIFDVARKSRALGSGLFCVNAPYGIDAELAQIPPLLQSS